MRPLILDFAIKRKGEMNIIYEYDFLESLNTVIINDEKKPFIDSSIDDVSLLTKTKVQRESDDDHLNLLELKTKTEINKERDEEQCTLLELQTKTFSKQERDD